jgi:hypothetical protein
MYTFLTAFLFLTTLAASAQEGTRPLAKGLLVKTNVLSLLAQRPTFSFEKPLSETITAEASFVQGRFNNLLFTENYHYNGFLLRVKKYRYPLAAGAANPYAALYLGNLKRTIQTEGQSLSPNGYIGYPSRDFTSNSIRGGGSLGLCYFTKTRFFVDGQASLGYGRYLNLDKTDTDTRARGYVDAQLWLSIGYCF